MNRLPASASRTGGAACSAQRGVGLVEILVAVLILSIGLLGIGLVQTRALANNNSSMSRAMAVVTSYSILEALRADRTGALTGDYNGTVTAGACGTAAATLAEAQILAWCQSLSLLGAASTTANVDCASTGGADPNANCTITIEFDDSRTGAGESTQTVATKAQL